MASQIYAITSPCGDCHLPGVVAQRRKPIIRQVSLGDFTPVEQTAILTLYTALNTIYALASRQPLLIERQRCDIHDILRHIQWKRLIAEIRRLGRGNGELPLHMHEVCHDLKGGALTALVGLLDVPDFTEWSEADMLMITNLSHDHALIMRDLLADLDPAPYVDGRLQTYHTRSLYERWHHTVYRIGEHTIRIVVSCGYQGPIAGCSCEPALLERVIYNLMNNAAHYSSDTMVELNIQPIAGRTDSVRIAVINYLSQEQQQVLEKHFHERLNHLFHGGFTTAGNGFGMHIAAQIIRDIHGYATIGECLAASDLGVTLQENQFICWFHWPVADRAVETAAS